MVTAMIWIVAPALSARDVWKAVEDHNAAVSPQEREWKFSDMSRSPFGFYRATAHLFYKDIADKNLQGPQDWETRTSLRTWISADYHLGNVGFESVAGNQRRFELNDFDEACRAPFHWDILRFLAKPSPHSELKELGSGERRQATALSRLRRGD